MLNKGTTHVALQPMFVKLMKSEWCEVNNPLQFNSFSFSYPSLAREAKSLILKRNKVK